jgi:hypothetical protein
VLGKFGLCLKLISEIGGLEWSVCSEILEPPSLVMGHGGSKNKHLVLSLSKFIL